MTTNKRASWKQAKLIYSLCAKNGDGNTNWAKLAGDGTLSWEDAWAIIQAFFKHDLETAEHLVRCYVPEFRINENKSMAAVPERAPVDLDGPFRTGEERLARLDDAQPIAQANVGPFVLLVVGPVSEKELTGVVNAIGPLGVASYKIKIPRTKSD